MPPPPFQAFAAHRPTRAKRELNMLLACLQALSAAHQPLTAAVKRCVCQRRTWLASSMNKAPLSSRSPGMLGIRGALQCLAEATRQQTYAWGQQQAMHSLLPLLWTMPCGQAALQRPQ